MKANNRPNLGAIGWVVALSLAFFAWRVDALNRELRHQVEGFYRAIELPAGALAAPLVGFANGERVVIDSEEESQPVLVLVLSAACGACDDNWPNWELLVQRHVARGGEVLPIDLTGLARQDYLDAHGIGNLVVVDSLTPETQLAYRFRFTPQTVILDQGRLVAGWTGVLTDETILAADSLLARGARENAALEPIDLSAIDRQPKADIRPACDGFPCANDSECGSRCTCEGADSVNLGTCVAKPSK